MVVEKWEGHEGGGKYISISNANMASLSCSIVTRLAECLAWVISRPR